MHEKCTLFLFFLVNYVLSDKTNHFKKGIESFMGLRILMEILQLLSLIAYGTLSSFSLFYLLDCMGIKYEFKVKLKAIVPLTTLLIILNAIFSFALTFSKLK